MNSIIKAHQEQLAEDRRVRLISLKEYCKVKRPLTTEDLIYAEVNRVDEINYQFERIEIPQMSYKKMKPSRIINHTFFSKFLA